MDRDRVFSSLECDGAASPFARISPLEFQGSVHKLRPCDRQKYQRVCLKWRDTSESAELPRAISRFRISSTAPLGSMRAGWLTFNTSENDAAVVLPMMHIAELK